LIRIPLSRIAAAASAAVLMISIPAAVPAAAEGKSDIPCPHPSIAKPKGI